MRLVDLILPDGVEAIVDLFCQSVGVGFISLATSESHGTRLFGEIDGAFVAEGRAGRVLILDRDSSLRPEVDGKAGVSLVIGFSIGLFQRGVPPGVGFLQNDVTRRCVGPIGKSGRVDHGFSGLAVHLKISQSVVRGYRKSG